MTCTIIQIRLSSCNYQIPLSCTRWSSSSRSCNSDPIGRRGTAIRHLALHASLLRAESHHVHTVSRSLAACHSTFACCTSAVLPAVPSAASPFADSDCWSRHPDETRRDETRRARSEGTGTACSRGLGDRERQAPGGEGCRHSTHAAARVRRQFPRVELLGVRLPKRAQRAGLHRRCKAQLTTVSSIDLESNDRCAQCVVPGCARWNSSVRLQL
jgi:hypothetical protein